MATTEYLDYQGLQEFDGELKKVLASKAEVALKADKTELADYVKNETLDGYVTEDQITDMATKTDLAKKADKDALENYATNEALALKADKTEIADMATKTELAEKADKSQLDAYATVTALNQKADASELAKYQTIEGMEEYSTDAEVSSAISTAKTEINGTIDSKVGAAKSELEATINAKVSSVYKPKGSSTFEALPTPAQTNLGDVYNVTNAFETTSAFVEGEGKKHPAGTNVAVIEQSGSYYWDALAGDIDLSGCLMKNEVAPIPSEKIKAMFN